MRQGNETKFTATFTESMSRGAWKRDHALQIVLLWLQKVELGKETIEGKMERTEGGLWK